MDQMKEKLARSLFTEDIEKQMISDGNFAEASFCRIISESLYVADDAPGISALDRCKKRLELINWLKEGFDFGDFYPYGARIKGLSYILYEGLRSSNEAKLYLYALANKGTYCVRAPNTLCSESFFSTMQELDPCGQSVLTADGVEKQITNFTTITEMKMKEDRSFFIRTKTDTAYPVISTETFPSNDSSSSASEDIPVCSCKENCWISCIIPRDHFFDTQFRARRIKKERPFTLSDINAPARGDLPIRSQYGYKMLPSKRLGLKLEETQ